ncbi:hypothetical protein ACF0H5_023372 [Mactra antiquata]
MFSILFGCQWVLTRVISWFIDRKNNEIPESTNTSSNCSQTGCSIQIHSIIQPVQNLSLSADSHLNHDIITVDETDGLQHVNLKRRHSPDTFQVAADDDDDDIVVDEVVIPAKSSKLSTAAGDDDNDGGVVVDEIVIPAKSSKLSTAAYDDDNDGGVVVDEIIIPAKSSELSTAAENVVSESIPKFDVTQVHGYTELPFLSDPDTIEFIKNSHTMFIMRGLPGSGKSNLVKCIQEVYKKDCVVCSADHFFTQSDGTYKFIKSKLQDAHKFCQDKTAYHCEKGTRVIVIDNTNIQRWEMSQYLKIAQFQHYYHVFIVEPLTPWRYDPDELAKYNSHDVEKDLIKVKLEVLQNNVMRPMYYGWFLNKRDSTMLVDTVKDLLRKCMDEMSDSNDWLENSSNPLLLDEIFTNLGVTYTDPLPMLHCTAAYLARRKKDAYHTCENVIEAIGKKFHLHVSGFVFSDRAVCAKVNLRSKVEMNQEGQGHMMYSRATGTCDENNWLLHLFLKEEEENLREKYRDTYTRDNKSKQAVFQHGASAHITLCYAREGLAKHSGDDILNICELEFYGNVNQFSTKVGKLSVYGNNMFQLELPSEIEVSSLFHGFYSGRN